MIGRTYGMHIEGPLIEEGTCGRPTIQAEWLDTYSQPAFFGELAIMLWLVIGGARPPAAATRLSSSASMNPLEP